MHQLAAPGALHAWSQAYRDDGLVVIRVHTPELSFEHDIDGVQLATAERAIDYPVDPIFPGWHTSSGRHDSSQDARRHARPTRVHDGPARHRRSRLSSVDLEATPAPVDTGNVWAVFRAYLDAVAPRPPRRSCRGGRTGWVGPATSPCRTPRPWPSPCVWTPTRWVRSESCLRGSAANTVLRARPRDTSPSSSSLAAPHAPPAAATPLPERPRREVVVASVRVGPRT
jgi:hypothetical protein